MSINAPVNQDDGPIALSVHSASVMIHMERAQSDQPENMFRAPDLHFSKISIDLCAE